MNQGHPSFIYCNRCSAKNLLPLPVKPDPDAEAERRKDTIRNFIGWLMAARDPDLVVRRVAIYDFVLNKPKDEPELMAKKRIELMERFGIAKSTLSECESAAEAALNSVSNPNSERQNEKNL